MWKDSLFQVPEMYPLPGALVACYAKGTKFPAMLPLSRLIRQPALTAGLDLNPILAEGFNLWLFNLIPSGGLD